MYREGMLLKDNFDPQLCFITGRYQGEWLISFKVRHQWHLASYRTLQLHMDFTVVTEVFCEI